MSTAYGVLSVTPGQNTQVTVANLNIACAIIANESPYTLKCAIDGTGYTRWIQALTIDRVDIPANGTGFTGNLVLSPVTVLSNTANAPSYAVVVETFGRGETPSGTYPVALSRAVNVGNTVQTTMGGANTLQNDNNVSGTQFIEATQSGSPSSNVFADNAGNFFLKQYVTGTLTTLFQVIANASTCMLLAATGKIAEVVGGLKVDQNLTVVGSSSLDNGAASTNGSGGFTVASLATSGHIDITANNVTLRMANAGSVLRDVLYVDGANATTVQCAALGGTLFIKDEDGTGITSFTKASGLTMINGGVNFLTGSITRVSKFTGSSANGKVTVNHGLGAVPDMVLVNFNLSGTPVAATIGPNMATLTSTQVDIWANVAANFVALAIKF